MQTLPTRPAWIRYSSTLRDDLLGAEPNAERVIAAVHAADALLDRVVVLRVEETGPEHGILEGTRETMLRQLMALRLLRLSGKRNSGVPCSLDEGAEAVVRFFSSAGFMVMGVADDWLRIQVDVEDPKKLADEVRAGLDPVDSRGAEVLVGAAAFAGAVLDVEVPVGWRGDYTEEFHDDFRWLATELADPETRETLHRALDAVVDLIPLDGAA